MSNDLLHNGHWSTVEDTYDHDTSNFGPFSELADAHRFCNATNALSVESLRLKIGDQALRSMVSSDTNIIPVHQDQIVESGLGLKLRLALGSLAYCPEYDCEKAIFEFIHTPQPFTVDAEAEARAVGCKWEYEWLQDKITSLSLDHCWCAALQADCMPEASNEEIKAFLFKILHKDEYLFITKKHHGELFRHTCSLCGATVLELLVECEGYGDSIHSYFTFPTSAELEDLSAGILGPKNYEQFVEQRCGIHKDGFDGMFYKRIKVGYIGLDSLEA